MMPDNNRRQDADNVKDLLIDEQPSRWPKLIGWSVALLMLGGGGYWLYLTPLDVVKNHASAIANTVLNTPILNGSAPAKETPPVAAPVPTPVPPAPAPPAKVAPVPSHPAKVPSAKTPSAKKKMKKKKTHAPGAKSGADHSKYSPNSSRSLDS